MSDTPVVQIVGAGLAGSEAAWQVASRGVRVVLHEMRPGRADRRPQDRRLRRAGLQQLVSRRQARQRGRPPQGGDAPARLADHAGGRSRARAGRRGARRRSRALLGRRSPTALAAHPLITIVRGEVPAIPPPRADGGPVIVATGPLTSDDAVGRPRRLVGAEHLCFYDAISPIVLAESIDRSKVFRASRWDRSLRGPASAPVPTSADVDAGAPARLPIGPACGVDDGQGDYLNCPFTRDEYDRFYDALVTAESATVHDFDNTKFFEGCLPIEVMAHRGRDTLRFGPMKPAGLDDPRTGRWAYAVVQLRQDTIAGDHFSLVGFQTQLKWAEQARVLRLDARARAGRVRALRHGAPQHLRQRPDGADADVADAAAAGSLPRRPGVGGRGLRRVGGLGAARGDQRGAPRAPARRRWSRRARPRSARSLTTSRTPIRRTTTRPTSPSASCRRSSGRRAARRIARPRSRPARSTISAVFRGAIDSPAAAAASAAIS